MAERLTCPTCGAPVRVVSGDEGTGHYEPLAIDELAKEMAPLEALIRAAETQTYNLDCLARDALSLAEHLVGYAPRSEKAQLYQSLTELRAAINAEMNRGSGAPDGRA